ncbi:MAG: hypothetical protein LBB78_07575 [Spirochaetaceae bacterium]|jgi:tetratricopeptide (TPR) repeat protein|nr:hypothetical protein [Spirochaetaceae bacterium]
MIGPYQWKKPLFLLLMVVFSLKAAITTVHAHGQQDKDPSRTGIWEQASRFEDIEKMVSRSSDWGMESRRYNEFPTQRRYPGAYSEVFYFTAGGLNPAFPLNSQTSVSESDMLKQPQGSSFERKFASGGPVPDAGEFDPVVTLRNEIFQIGSENDKLLQEVRDLINNVRETYFAGNFDEAENMLVRYRTANRGENPEITYWLTLVRGARSLRSGRVIPITAPLYAEMSQLLSDAKKSYDEGVLFINTDRRSAGLTKLTEARQKTRQVRHLFPVNEEADFLELRIDQITDPSAFNRSFQRRLEEAVAGIKNRSSQAFTDLQTLAGINPQYPGMAGILEQAEIDMGYRPSLPNSLDLVKSNELTTMAQNMVYSKNRSLYPFALELLNQALQLNPDNGQAMVLKDRVQTDLGGTETIVLDDDAEQDYQRAVRELQQGNPITALSIIQQLLRNPRYRNSAKIIALQRRIESVL